MQIAVDAIIPITDAAKHFKTACEKTKTLGTTFVFKNNRPEIVMMDISRYEQLLSVLDSLEQSEIAVMVAERSAKDSGQRFSLDEVLNP